MATSVKNVSSSPADSLPYKQISDEKELTQLLATFDAQRFCETLALLKLVKQYNYSYENVTEALALYKVAEQHGMNYERTKVAIEARKRERVRKNAYIETHKERIRQSQAAWQREYRKRKKAEALADKSKISPAIVVNVSEEIA